MELAIGIILGCCGLGAGLAIIAILLIFLAPGRFVDILVNTMAKLG